MTQPSFLTVGSERDDPFVTHALRQLGVWLGIAFTQVALEQGRPLTVYYGNDLDQACAVRIPFAATLDSRELPPLPSVGMVDGWKRESDPFPFDLFAALRYWLADEGNRALGPEAFDEHERLVADCSVQHALGLRDVPVVNHYVECFRAWIEGRCGIETHRLLPPASRAAVVLTHDVDSPTNPGDPRHVLGLALRSLRRGQRRLPALYWGAGYIGRSAISRVRRPDARHWVFDDLIAAEQRYGFQSTLFFAAVSRFDRGASDLDVAYDIADERFRSVFDLLHEARFGIGIHLSYGALDDATEIRRERAILEEAAGCEVVVSRHHYWHMTRPMWPTLAAHAEAGLRFDSSVSYQDLPGFRLGVALPFEPWDPEGERAIRTVQVPTMVMDTMLLDGANQDMNGALTQFDGLLENLKNAGGIAAIDWHEYTSVPAGQRRESLGHLYLAILDRLAADHQVAVLDYPEIERGLRTARAASVGLSDVMPSESAHS